MRVECTRSRNYLFIALSTSPQVMARLLENLGEGEANFHPNLERFSIREAIAHLADWDDIFLSRMKKTRDQDNYTIEPIDEGQRALDFHYAQTDVFAQLHLFAERRHRLIEFLQTLTHQQWQRTSLHSELGPMSLEALAPLVSRHDTYHIQQILEWREEFSKQ